MTAVIPSLCDMPSQHLHMESAPLILRNMMVFVAWTHVAENMSTVSTACSKCAWLSDLSVYGVEPPRLLSIFTVDALLTDFKFHHPAHCICPRLFSITFFKLLRIFKISFPPSIGPGWRSRCSDSLQAGRPGDRIPVRQDFPHPSTPALEPGYRIFTGAKPAGAWC